MTVLRVLFCVALLVLWGMAGGPVWAQTAVPPTLEVLLFPEFDQFGGHFEVVQAYENVATGEKSITVGIYDTGSSLVTFSVLDQEFLFPLQGYPTIPVIAGAVATADAIGGTLHGNVSVAGRVYAAGGSALTIDFNTFAFSFDLSNAISIDGNQSFVGTVDGSPNLPSIVGTPINAPSATHPGGLATVVDQSGYSIDLGPLDPAFVGIPIELPDVRFLPSGSNLVPAANTYQTVTIPLALVGIDNTANPGNEISSAPNPMQNNTAVAYTPAAPGSPTITVSNQQFLFDTGAQLSIISSAIAAQLGLTDSLGHPIVTPIDTIDVQGAGDAILGLPGYILDSLTVPRTDGGFVSFSDVPVYVLDIGFGIDGILGTNLFNAADSLLYDPYNVNGPQVSVLFLNDRTLEVITEEAGPFANLDDPDFADANLILSLLGSRYAKADILLPGIRVVPEPSTMSLALIGLAALAIRLRRRIR
jgi:hypothetical protein